MAQLIRAANAMSTMAAGKLERQRLASTKKAQLPRPKANAVKSKCCSDGLLASALQLVRRPSSAGNCDARISSAAACVKPPNTGDVTRFSSQPKRTTPSVSCSSPDSKAIHAASATQWALPGSAIPVRDAPISRLVSAVGPTPRRVDELQSTATRAGTREA